MNLTEFQDRVKKGTKLVTPTGNVYTVTKLLSGKNGRVAMIKHMDYQNTDMLTIDNLDLMSVKKR